MASGAGAGDRVARRRPPTRAGSVLPRSRLRKRVAADNVFCRKGFAEPAVAGARAATYRLASAAARAWIAANSSRESGRRASISATKQSKR